MGRPIIGITGELEAARWRTWIREAVVSPVSYTRAVERAGGTPVVLPPVPASSVPGLIARIDGLVVAAGRDVDPSLYDEAAHEQTDQPDHRRDRFELLMTRAAIEADLPFLAIARGMQLLNVARGGTLVQHLPDRLGNESHKPDPVKLTVHDVQVSPDSKLSQILGTTAQVPAAHHQAINSIGSGLVTVAWTLDQVVEAVEVQGHKFGIGVQWFPEEGDDLRLFEALVTAAKPAPQPAEVPSRSKRSSKRHAARSLSGGNRGRLLFRAVGPEPLSRLLPAELISVASRLLAAELVRMRHLDLHLLVGCGLGW
jgi:putative glutamine amidotransferase